jgi:hypothetical protein
LKHPSPPSKGLLQNKGFSKYSNLIIHYLTRDVNA